MLAKVKKMEKNKICGNCKHYSERNGDLESSDYAIGYRWGWCFAPIPQYTETDNNDVKYNENAKDCECYKKIKPKRIPAAKVSPILTMEKCKDCQSNIILTYDIGKDSTQSIGSCVNPSCVNHKGEKIKALKRGRWQVSFISER